MRIQILGLHSLDLLIRFAGIFSIFQGTFKNTNLIIPSVVREDFQVAVSQGSIGISEQHTSAGLYRCIFGDSCNQFGFFPFGQFVSFYSGTDAVYPVIALWVVDRDGQGIAVA